MEQDFKEYISQDDSYFSEGHLYGWFNTQYLGKDMDFVKHNLRTVHDNSGELEVAEDELGRKLTDEERDQLVKRFHDAVLKALVVHQGIVVAFVDSCGDTKVSGH